MEKVILYIEALIFASEQSVTLEDIYQVLEVISEEPADHKIVSKTLDEIKEKYDKDEFAIQLVRLNGGYQFLTKKKYSPVINQLQIQRSKKKLSHAAMETLAIIAYREPVTKLEIEQIRGVSCDYTIQKLLEKELIKIAGKGESAGKPILYSTSQLFMDYFGINSASDLPQIKDIVNPSNEIGSS